MPIIVLQSSSLYIRAGVYPIFEPLYKSLNMGIELENANILEPSNNYIIGEEAEILKDYYPLDYSADYSNNNSFDIQKHIYVNALLNVGIETKKESITEISDYKLNWIISPFEESKEMIRKIECSFEDLLFNKIAFTIDGACALYSMGKTTGLVIDSGHSKTTVMPIIDGVSSKNFLKYFEIAGKSLSEEIIDKIPNSLNENSYLQYQIDHVKKLLSHKIEDNSEMPMINLPDGIKINLKKELLHLPDIIFEKCDKNRKSFKSTIYESVEKIDFNIQKRLFDSIMITGGNSQTKNFDSRLMIELNNYNGNIKFKSINELRNLKSDEAFSGAVKLMELPGFESLYIKKNEYQEKGESIIYRQNIYL